MLSLLFVALAFVRAQYFSSTGIRIAGDGVDYAALATALELEGRAPFVYRPAVPFLVGLLFGADPLLGFALVCAVSMFAAFLLAGSQVPDRLAGCLLVALLFLNYQVLFAAANVARLDISTLAIQLLFVSLALRGKERLFFGLLPLAAPLKESILLGLGALVLVAFPRRRATFTRFAASAAVFVGIHLLLRGLARPTAAVPPYAEGFSPAALSSMIASNLTPLLPVHLFVAWGGLCFIALHAFLAPPGVGARRDPLLIGAGALLLAFPVPLATDLHRAWFELLAPVVLFSVLVWLRGCGNDPTPSRKRARQALAAALLASAIPYTARAVASGHLYLLILQERLTISSAAFLGLALAAAAAAVKWRTQRAT